MINFFPEEWRNQSPTWHLSCNMRALGATTSGQDDGWQGRRAAIEILLNTPIVTDKIFKGEFGDLKSIMDKSRELGMRTFDWSLFELYNDGHIGYEEAIRNADSANELRLNIKLRSARGEPASATASGQHLAFDDYKNPAELAEERKRELESQEKHRREFEAERLARLQTEEQKDTQPERATIEVDNLGAANRCQTGEAAP